MLQVIKIKEWYGRLGNNINQLINAIYHAKQKKGLIVCQNVMFPPHALEQPVIYEGLLKKSEDNKDTLFHAVIKDFILNFSGLNVEEINVSKLVFDERFFYDEEDIHVSTKDKQYILQEYIYPILNLNPNVVNEYKITDTTLVVHIRSGDIFTPNCHPFYIQPPVSFYTKIISENKFDNIILVTEKDKSNPAVDFLTKYLSNVSVVTPNLIDSISIILFSKHFVCNTCGTFGLMLGLASKKIQTIYLSYYFNPDEYKYTDTCFQTAKNFEMFMKVDNLNNVDIKKYYIHNYIKPFGWNPGDSNVIHKLKNHPVSEIFELESM